LNAKVAKLTAFIDLDDARPTRQAYEVFEEVSEKIQAQLSRYRKVVVDDVSALNEGIGEAGLPLIVTDRD
jgi:hypothetical protein